MDKPTPLTVPRDSGRNVIKGSFTLLPLINAVQATTARKKAASKFDWSSVDVVVDRSGLRKLVGWANDRSDYWRIDTQLAGEKTVLMISWSPVTKETSGPPQSGYGFNFEKAFTHPAPGCKGGISHNRIVTYVRVSNVRPENTQALIANRILGV